MLSGGHDVMEGPSLLLDSSWQVNLSQPFFMLKMDLVMPISWGFCEE
jgi:hypothetical protein